MKTKVSLIPAALGILVSGSSLLAYAANHAEQSIQLGPRPFFLVEDMD